MLDNLYENIGGKIKNWAKWIFIVEAIGAVMAGIALITTDDDLILAGLLTLFCGPIVAYVGSWILYAFGELVEDVHAIRNKEGTAAEEKAKREAALKAKREAEQKEKQMAEQILKREREERERWQKENEAEIAKLSDDDFIDIVCPECGETLSFLKNEIDAICPECGAEFKIK